MSDAITEGYRMSRNVDKSAESTNIPKYKIGDTVYSEDFGWGSIVSHNQYSDFGLAYSVYIFKDNMKREIIEDKLRREDGMDIQIKKAIDQCVDLGINIVWVDGTAGTVLPDEPTVIIRRTAVPEDIHELLIDKIYKIKPIKRPSSAPYEEYYKVKKLKK